MNFVQAPGSEEAAYTPYYYPVYPHYPPGVPWGGYYVYVLSCQECYDAGYSTGYEDGKYEQSAHNQVALKRQAQVICELSCHHTGLERGQEICGETSRTFRRMDELGLITSERWMYQRNTPTSSVDNREMQLEENEGGSAGEAADVNLSIQVNQTSPRLPENPELDSVEESASEKALVMEPAREEYPEEEAFEERLAWVCARLKTPIFHAPQKFIDDLCNFLTLFFGNFHKEYPTFEKILESLYALPSEVQVNKILPKQESVLKKNGPALQSMREVLSNRGKHPSFRDFLRELVDKLEGSAEKALRRRLNQKREALYCAIEDCLQDEEFTFASNKARDLVTAYEKGDENARQEVFQALMLLAGREKTVLRTRNHLMNLLKKDQDFEGAEEIIEACLKQKRCRSINFWEGLRDSHVMRKGDSSIFGKYLALPRERKLLSAEYLTPELLEYWLDHYEGHQDYLEAFWACVPKCSRGEEAVLRACIEGVKRLWDQLSGQGNSVIYENQGSVEALLHLCKAWSEHARNLQLPSIGTPLIIWWNHLKEEASKDQRKAFMIHLKEVVYYYLHEVSMYANYLLLLLKEFDEKVLAWEFTPEFFLGVFKEIGSIFEEESLDDKQLETLNQLSKEYWKRIDFEAPEFQDLLIDKEKLKNFWYFFSKAIKEEESSDSESFEESSESEEIEVEGLRKEFDEYVLHALKAKIKRLFEESAERASHLFKNELPGNFWPEFLQQMSKGIDQMFTVDSCSEGNLYLVRMITWGRWELGRKLIEALDQRSQNQMQLVEAAANEFQIENEKEYESDPEVQKNLKGYFNEVGGAENFLSLTINKVKLWMKTSLEESFWEEVRRNSMEYIDNNIFTINQLENLKKFLCYFKEVFSRKAKEELEPKHHQEIQEVVKALDQMITSICNH